MQLFTCKICLTKSIRHIQKNEFVMKRVIAILAGMCLLFSACDETIPENGETSGLKISSGSICGWCAGGDSLVLTQGKYDFVAFNPCSEWVYIIRKSGALTSKQWSDLLSEFNYEEFSAVDINTCNVCADGCDNWIEIELNEQKHRISFGQSHTDSVAIMSILPFIGKLNELKDELTTITNE